MWCDVRGVLWAEGSRVTAGGPRKGQITDPLLLSTNPGLLMIGRNTRTFRGTTTLAASTKVLQSRAPINEPYKNHRNSLQPSALRSPLSARRLPLAARRSPLSVVNRAHSALCGSCVVETDAVGLLGTGIIYPRYIKLCLRAGVDPIGGVLNLIMPGPQISAL